jgi:hypothetical protein
MSRDLPARPNLDHLKKQAKELLQTLKQQDSGAQLADAQHAIAREYGFGSWPRLKAHVEGAAAESNPFVGTWTADISRSKLHPLNRLHAASVGFAVQGDDVTIDYVMVDESGRTDRGANMFVADGNERPSRHREGYIMRARWLGSHSLEAVVSRRGEFEGRVEYVVSPDGGTLTLSASWRGGVEQVSVFSRAT